MRKTTYGGELLHDQELIATRVTTPESGSGCTCTFELEDEHGKYHGNRAHRRWDIVKQAHDNPGWQFYLECHGCGYQWARNYWKHDHLQNVETQKQEDY